MIRVAACGCIHRENGTTVVWCKRHASEAEEVMAEARRQMKRWRGTLDWLAER